MQGFSETLRYGSQTMGQVASHIDRIAESISLQFPTIYLAQQLRALDTGVPIYDLLRIKESDIYQPLNFQLRSS